MIWFTRNFSLPDLTALGRGTMSEHIGIEFTEIGDNYLKGRMPVDQRTNQPYGLLHGGASCVLAKPWAVLLLHWWSINQLIYAWV